MLLIHVVKDEQQLLYIYVSLSSFCYQYVILVLM